MYLKHLILTNFKNHAQTELSFSEKMNCFIGNNGTGKTNLLDAIHYLSFCKSYFNPIDTQNIRHGEDFFAIHGTFAAVGKEVYSSDENIHENVISCIQKIGERKHFKINQKEYERLADHIGSIPLVMISPYDRDLINEGSEVRRRFIDTVISQFDRQYLDNLINYNKVLAQRNKLLKADFVDELMIEALNVQLIKFGVPIFTSRKAFFEQFAIYFQDFFAWITDHKENVEIRYSSALDSEHSFAYLLKNAFEKDKILGYSTVGIHRDDLQLLIDDFPVKKFGSQGQQKSYVIAMRLAQFEFTKEKKGFYPILLLDDIFDKLDDLRVNKIIELVGKSHYNQVFITDTDEHRVAHIFEKHQLPHKIFYVKDGQVS